VVAATLFGGIEVARYPTLEQAEWRAKQLAAEAERSPRGYVQYVVKPVESPPIGPRSLGLQLHARRGRRSRAPDPEADDWAQTGGLHLSAHLSA
jgi:hypothetical protein